jgi:hypothetical protein
MYALRITLCLLPSPSLCTTTYALRRTLCRFPCARLSSASKPYRVWAMSPRLQPQSNFVAREQVIVMQWNVNVLISIQHISILILLVKGYFYEGEWGDSITGTTTLHQQGFKYLFCHSTVASVNCWRQSTWTECNHMAGYWICKLCSYNKRCSHRWPEIYNDAVFVTPLTSDSHQ